MLEAHPSTHEISGGHSRVQSLAELPPIVIDRQPAASNDSDSNLEPSPHMLPVDSRPGRQIAPADAHGDLSPPAPTAGSGDRIDNPPPSDTDRGLTSPPPEKDPRAVNVYPVVPEADPPHNAIAVSPDSPLAHKQVEVVAWGERISSGSIGYPGKMEVRDSQTGETLVHAEATRHTSYETGDPGETAGMVAVVIDPSAGGPPQERRPYMPPDKITIDVVPEDSTMASSAVKALLEGYVSDAVERLTNPGPVPGEVSFTPAAVEKGWLPVPLPEEAVRSVILGDETVGVTRILLNDHQTNIDARQGTTDTPAVPAVSAALTQLGCEVTNVQVAPIDRSARGKGVEIQFTRSPDGPNAVGTPEPQRPPQITPITPTPPQLPAAANVPDSPEQRHYAPGQLREAIRRSSALLTAAGVDVKTLLTPRQRDVLGAISNPAINNAEVAEQIGVVPAHVSKIAASIVARLVEGAPAGILTMDLVQPAGHVVGERPVTVGTLIDDIRREAGMHLRELAQRTDLSYSALRRFLAGETHPSSIHQVLHPVLRELGVGPEAVEGFTALYQKEGADRRKRSNPSG